MAEKLKAIIAIFLVAMHLQTRTGLGGVPRARNQHAKRLVGARLSTIGKHLGRTSDIRKRNYFQR